LIKQVDQYGYFEYPEYDESLFYPKDKVVIDGKDYKLSDYSFLKGPGYIRLEEKEKNRKRKGFLDNVTKFFSSDETPQINTKLDSDVIFALLDHYMNLRWDN